MSILLKKSGKIFKENNAGKKVEVKSFIPYLSEPFYIENGTTFEKFFNIVMNEADAYSTIFASQLGHYPLRSFSKEWKKEYVKEKNDKMKYLEVRRATVELWDIEKIHSFYCQFGGVGGKTKYGLDFLQLYKLKKYPLKLSTKLDFIKIITKKKAKYDDKIIFSTDVYITLYDVIGAILDEITFYGEPATRDVYAKDLISSIDEYKKTKQK